MSDVAEMLAQLEALRKLRYGGAARVVYRANGVTRETEYRSGAELAAAIADLENRLYGARPRNIPVRGIDGFTGGRGASGREAAEIHWRNGGRAGREGVGD